MSLRGQVRKTEHPAQCLCFSCCRNPRMRFENRGLLKERLDELIALHGTLTKAAAAVGIHHSYLSRLFAGEKLDPSPEVAKKLGLLKVVTVRFERYGVEV